MPTVGSMHAAELSRPQCDAIIAQLQPTTAYLAALRKRMDDRGWHVDDPAYQAARRAHEALVDLRMALTYACHALGVGAA